ncbi:MAG: hypothetical protein HND58_07640 [Planctomycetota bacterium]|nr:MAG: hypothetical protein HND58_07640 [Planctomycetota bacterium]
MKRNHSAKEADAVRENLKEIRRVLHSVDGDNAAALECLRELAERRNWTWARLSGADIGDLVTRVNNDTETLLLEFGLDRNVTLDDIWLVSSDSNRRIRNVETVQRTLSTKLDLQTLADQIQGKDDIGDRPWRRFLDATDCFQESASTRYVLLTDSLPPGLEDRVRGMGLVPWTAIIDFDTSPDSGGLFSAIKPTLSDRRTVLRVAGNQVPSLHPRDHTLWIHARGYEGASSTRDDGTYRSWNRLRSSSLTRSFESITQAISPNPIICVVIWNDDSLHQYVETTLSIIDRTMGDLTRYVFVSETKDCLASLAKTYGEQSTGFDVFPMSMASLSSAFQVLLDTNAPSVGERCVLPTSDGTPASVDRQDRIWLEQELELVHYDVGLDGPDDPEPYRKGADITWRDINLNHDCARDLHTDLHARVAQDLRDRRAVRVNLVHSPGAGGTTVARRLLWTLREQYPCTVLRHSVGTTQTVERLRWIHKHTNSSQLLLIDGSSITDGQADDLYEAVGAEQLPVAMLIVSRQFAFSGSPPIARRSFRLRPTLSDSEFDRFISAYGLSRMDRRGALAALRTGSRPEQQTAFYVGLVTYGREFNGLSDYVISRLHGATAIQRKVLLFLAFAHHFGQQTLHSQLFAGLLGVPRNRPLDLEHYLTPSMLELLYKENSESWRTIHDLIAEEVLQNLLAPQSKRALWTHRLSECSREFAHFLRGEWQFVGKEISELAQRIFVYRDNSGILGTEMSSTKKFSQLVELIPTEEGRLELLRELTLAFPEEAHFHAHLGRFCGLSGRFDEAQSALETAIALNDRDSVLHHMMGMIGRHRLYLLTEKQPPAELDDVIAFAIQASEAFEKARELNPESEHAYVSEVQVYIRLLDFAGRRRGGRSEVVAAAVSHGVLRDALDKAESLLEQLRLQRGGSQPSNYELDCRAKLDAMYGNDEKALQAWDSILGRPDQSYKPSVRRQVVRTLLRRSGGEWVTMKEQSVSRCVRLLQENLDDAPADATSLRMWLRAVRHLKPVPSVESVLEKIALWRAHSDSLDAAYYQFVLYSLLALDGSVLSTREAERALSQSQELSKYRKRRTWSYEWLGRGRGIQQLVHQFELGEWDATEEFYPNRSRLHRIVGHVDSIDGPQRGIIELESGQKAFFVPARTTLVQDRDMNTKIDCYLGFSYDGLRAWDVRTTEQ